MFKNILAFSRLEFSFLPRIRLMKMYIKSMLQVPCVLCGFVKENTSDMYEFSFAYTSPITEAQTKSL